jgi:hypothetical protein
MAAIAPRKVSLISPIDGEGNAMKPESAGQALSWVLQMDRTLHQPGRVNLISSGQSPLPRTSAAHDSAK